MRPTSPLRRRFAALAACGLPSAAQPVRAQPAWPTRPVRRVVPVPAGGATDLLARVVRADVDRWSAVIRRAGIRVE